MQSTLSSLSQLPFVLIVLYVVSAVMQTNELGIRSCLFQTPSIVVILHSWKSQTESQVSIVAGNVSCVGARMSDTPNWAGISDTPGGARMSDAPEGAGMSQTPGGSRMSVTPGETRMCDSGRGRDV